jgi:hypothetical protein
MSYQSTFCRKYYHSCISVDPIHIIETLRIIELRDKIIFVYFCFQKCRKTRWLKSHILIMKYYNDSLNVIHARGLTNSFVITSKTNK